jgi:hypothetical protein
VAFFTAAAPSAAFFTASFTAFFFVASSAAFFLSLPLQWPSSLPPRRRPSSLLPLMRSSSQLLHHPWASSLRLHLQPLSLQRPLLLPLCRAIVKLLLGPPPLGVVARATANEAGHGTEAAEGAHRPLICLCQMPSSASAVKHHHQMILHHPLSLAGGRSGDSTALATHGTCPGDLYTMGLVTPMDRCNADIVHRRYRHPQQLPCGLVHAEWLVGHWRGDKAVGRRIGVSFPITSVNASSPSVDPSPRSSHVMSFTPV